MGSIVACLFEYKQTGQQGLWDLPPSQGELPPGIARRLLATRSQHTAQPGHVFFAMWEGFGYSSSLVFLFPEDMPGQERRRAEQKAQDALDAKVRAWRELVDGAAAFEVPGGSPEIERPPHRLVVLLAEQGLDISLEPDLSDLVGSIGSLLAG